MSIEIEDKTIYKIIIVGDSSVGKTCIFKKLTSGTFNEKNISTIGMDRRTLSYKINTPEGKEIEIEVQLWDTAGQERFRAITASYYKSSQGLLLMYDITKRETFINVENWIESIKESLGDEKYLIVLVGNKIDLVNERPSLREVTLEEAKDLCKDKDIYWGGECSAKDFTEIQLNDLFSSYTKEIYKKVGENKFKGQIVSKETQKPKKSCCKK